MTSLPPEDQVAFDRVTSHLLTQNQQSGQPMSCLYRDGELSCAVGCLIDDEHYEPTLEGCGWSAENVLEAVRNSLGFEPSGRLLSGVQKIHDNVKPQFWEAHLRELAKNLELKFNAPS
jgi:hypothetical protein